MIRIMQEKDRVLLDFGCRNRDFFFTCGQAENLEMALVEVAGRARASTEFTLIKGHCWNVKVESYDGQVVLRITPPIQLKGDTVSQMPMTAEAALKLADMVRFKRQQAAYKIRLVTDRRL